MVCSGQSTTSDAVCQGSTCTITCRGDNYDVDSNPANGCERQYTDGAHTQGTAFPLGSVGNCDSNAETPVRTIYSDARVHANPSVPAFNIATGAAPQWWVVNAPGGVLCQNDLDVTLNMTSGTGNCYRLMVQTNQVTLTAQTSGGVAHIQHGIGAYISGTPVFFMVEKICGTNVREAASYTIMYHL
ncbi:MAG: hypothetical protein U0075_03985 [Thermomicrobiales bacterium]